MPHSLVILDEIGEGTEPGEGAALAQALLEALVERGARVIATTHFNRLKELAGDDPRFANASAEFDPRTLAPTYRIHAGVPGSSGAMYAAERMGLDAGGGRARARSARPRGPPARGADPQPLGAAPGARGGARAREPARARETELARDAWRAAAREPAQQPRGAARRDEDGARGRVQGGARGDRRGGARAAGRGRRGALAARRPGRAANRAQQRLREIAARVERAERAHAEPVPRCVGGSGVLVPGARVELRGVSGEAVVLEAPDRRGRVAVRSGSARSVVPLERVARVLGPRPAGRARDARARGHRARGRGPARAECDLRGLRVDEALDRADAHLQSHLGLGGAQVVFIHGHGSGALRDAVRGWLRGVAEVAELRSGAPAEGGNGVTVVRLES